MDNLEEIDKFLEKHNLPKLNQEEIEYMNRQITSTKIEADQNLPTKKKAQGQMASQSNFIKIQRRAYTYPAQIVSKICRGRKTFKPILRGHHHPDTKTRQRYHQKKKIILYITDEHGCKNPQQNSNEQNLPTR